jgi:TPR repeat protein
MSFSDIRKRAESGESFAQTFTGFMLEHGLLVIEDRARARGWYERAADRNFAPAQYALFLLLEHDSAKEAFEWLRKAAESNYPAAQYTLASYHLDGTPPATADNELALSHMTSSAEAGFRPALRRLAMMHEDGVGGIADPAKAGDYLRRAAESGDHVAAVMLGERLLKSHNDTEVSEGLEWIYSAAKNAEPSAFKLLARVYGEGLFGVEKDQEVAGLFEALTHVRDWLY